MSETSNDGHLKDYQIVLVGCGKMGASLLTGIAESGSIDRKSLVCIDRSHQRAEDLASITGAHLGFERGDRPVLFIFAVKPSDMKAAISEYEFEEGDYVISVAAGVRISTLREWVGEAPDLVRTMPNTPALVGAGVTGILGDGEVSLRPTEELFCSVGSIVHLDHESEFDALTAISGSGPAYVFTAIEALADGGVLMGLSRKKAVKLARQVVAGSARLAIHEPVHTAQLKDRVASPGGTTIAGLAALEKNGFRHALIEAVKAAAERSREMGE